MLCEGLYEHNCLVKIFGAIATILIVHYVYLLWNSDYWIKLGVFCPNPNLLFGNLLGQVFGNKNILYELDDLYREYRDKYPYIGIFKFREPRLLLIDPDVIKDITVKYFKNFQGTEHHGKIDEKSDPLFGNHSFFLVGDAWKTKRAEIAPAFTNSRIKALYSDMLEVSQEMAKFIRRKISEKNHDGIDCLDLAERYTMAIISKSIYNIDPKLFEGGESELLKKSIEVTAPTKRNMIILILTTIYPFLCKYFKVCCSKPGADKFFFGQMDRAMALREENKIQRVDFLDFLISSRKKREISDIDIACHGASFLINGFETASAALSATLYELAQNSKCQEALRDEIRREIPDDKDFTFDNIMSLQYLDQVWNENLRLNGPAATLTRLCNEPIELNMPGNKKLFFEKNLKMYLPTFSIHRDPKYYPNPQQFDPDRFSYENGGVKAYTEKGIFFPFGLGPRTCPINHFAIAKCKVALAQLVRNFKFTLNSKNPDTCEVHPQSIVYVLHGYSLNFTEIVSE